MKLTKRMMAALLILMLLVLPLAGCGAEQSEELSLSIAASDVPNTLDPAQVDTGTEKTIVTHLYENLMKPTESGVVPAMAKSYVYTDNMDGTETYTFTLRDDMKWSNGRSVSADDFVYAWQRLVDPDIASPNRALLNVVEGYDLAGTGDLAALQVWAENPTTLVVVLNCHCPYFLSSICTAAGTMPVPYGIDENGTDWGTRFDSLVTNGAYQITSVIDSDKTLVIHEIEEYYDTKRLGVSEITFHLGMSQKKALAAFENGEIDVMLDAPQSEESTLSFNPEVGVLLINQMAGTLKKEELRQAMSAVLDRQAIADSLGENYFPAEGLVPRGTASTDGKDFRELSGSVIDNDPENYEINCSTAVEKMESVGLTDTARSNLGVITLLTDNTPTAADLAKQIQQTWLTKLSVMVTIKAVTPEEMQDKLESGEFTMALTTVASDRNDASGYLDQFSSGSATNYGMYYSNAYDMLMRIAASSSSKVARDAYLEDAERLLLESGYVIPLYNTAHSWQVRIGLNGALDNGLDAHFFGYVRKVQETA